MHKSSSSWDVLSSWLYSGAYNALWQADVWLGWPRIRCHSGLREWESLGADFKILSHYSLWGLHRWNTSIWRNIKVPAREVPFTRVSSRGHWALLCCNEKIKLFIIGCILGSKNQSELWRNKSGRSCTHFRFCACSFAFIQFPFQIILIKQQEP